MIAYVRGTLAAMEEDRVIIDVGGIGYGVYMAGRAMGMLPRTGKEVKIHTYLHVKEDMMQLYGFLTRDELSVFRMLIGVNGIGPKGALGILSALSPDDLRFAVASNDVKAIQAAPGIGKKTAEKLILELKDKLKLEDALEHISDGEMSSVSGTSDAGYAEVQSEAVQALTALGYGSTEALKAVKQVEITEDMKVEEVLKQALRKMMF
ncbi:MAG: Holliday junction branch migration protein RuvA [Dorea sp.]